jgi:uncharacterized membrane protein YgcG
MSIFTKRLRLLSLCSVIGVVGGLASVASASVTPAIASLTVPAGGSAATSISIGVPAGGTTPPPTAVDVEIAIDTTGSMTTGIAQARADATALMTSMRVKIPGAKFAIVQFRDFGDTPVYNVEQPMTSNTALVNAALGRLVAFAGGDAPEAINLVYHNAAVPNTGGPIGWRAGVAKFLVVLSDASPHGAGTAGIANCTDPSVDPLGFNTATTLAELSAAGRSLFMVLEPGAITSSLACYQFLSLAVGGNSRGLPGGTNLATQLVPLISGTATTVANLNLVVANSGPVPALNSWISMPTLGPIAMPATVPATITVNPPTGTPAGLYHFNLIALADGIDIGHVALDITVTATTPTPVPTPTPTPAPVPPSRGAGGAGGGRPGGGAGGAGGGAGGGGGGRGGGAAIGV